MEAIRFKRFMKKSLILLHKVIDDEALLKNIKNKKILQTLQTINLNHGIVEEQTINEYIDLVISLVKINNNKIATGSMRKYIQIWDLKTGDCLNTLNGHSNSVEFVLKINENKIGSSSKDNSIKIWDVITGKCLKTLEGHSDFVGFLFNFFTITKTYDFVIL